MQDPIAKHAVIVGAGMGGLTAAKALSAYFERVTVLERDALPDVPGQRQGTPQARHAHVLLPGGQRALAELFPDIEQELEHEGAVKTRIGLELMWERPGYDPYPQRDLGIDTLCLSRPLLEFVTRRRVEQETNISLRSRCRVAEPGVSADRSAVTGIRCEFAAGQVETLPADLVVDATGRAALTLAALEAVGLERPDETEIGIDQAYSTAVFEIPDDAPTNWTALIHLPNPPHNGRGAFMFPMEHGRWIVSLGANHGDAHPGDIDGLPPRRYLWVV